MSLFSKVNVRLILIAMVFALAPTTAYAPAYVRIGDISAKMPGMRVTDKTTVHEVAVFAARHAGIDVDRISLSWRGRELNGRRTLTSYTMPDEVTFQMKLLPAVQALRPPGTDSGQTHREQKVPKISD